MVRVGSYCLNRASQLFAKRNVRNRTGTGRKFGGFGLYVKDTYASSTACKSLSPAGREDY